MPNEREIQKIKTEYPEFFKQVSPELLDFIFSEEIPAKIAEICLENGVEDEEKIEKIAYRVALALLEQIPKESLVEILEKGAGLSREAADQISIAIDRHIFSQIPKTKPEETHREEGQKEEGQLVESPKASPPEPKEEKPKGSSKEDTYREPIG